MSETDEWVTCIIITPSLHLALRLGSAE